MTGPLHGLRVLELAGIGPGPYACMLLADLGADVLRVNRPSGVLVPLAGPDLLARGRRSLTLDLKAAGAASAVLRLVEAADVLVEGNRPGVTERLGIGPDVCLARNPRLVYARMTGWGQDGPWADHVGHDINYVGLTGALAAIGEPSRKPVPPLNLVADFGGGALFCVVGVLAALFERTVSGRGQVVDAAMVDGVTSMMTMFYGMLAGDGWSGDRGTNLLDGGAPFYDTYECADGEYVAVGALEPQFFADLLDALELKNAPEQFDTAAWPELRRQLAQTFVTRNRDEWAALFERRSACVTPVLHLHEAGQHSHLASRRVTVEVDGVLQPGVAPRFSRTPAPGPSRQQELRPLGLTDWGLNEQELHQFFGDRDETPAG